jgi:hypothetical protein
MKIKKIMHTYNQINWELYVLINEKQFINDSKKQNRKKQNIDIDQDI